MAGDYYLPPAAHLDDGQRTALRQLGWGDPVPDLSGGDDIQPRNHTRSWPIEQLPTACRHTLLTLTVVSEAADVLGVSPPTVRAWVKAGILEEASDARSPQRVEVLSLADVKRIVDMLRAEGQNRDLLAAVYRRLRDGDLLASPGLEGSINELGAGRTVPIGDDLREEMAALDRSE